ncbi:hypothetical protein ACTQ49_05240 [Luteococcus sp. Sow4_B9]|uniref:hypothetical protein n=1 Tax=Luteococcus sp. Sow4_B9 TaxID=3438792 RepID=UPI003F98EB50
MPITVDQPFWADQLHQAHLGTRPLDARRLRAWDVARALDEAHLLRPHVARVAGVVSAEHGRERAIDRLERLIR